MLQNSPKAGQHCSGPTTPLPFTFSKPDTMKEPNREKCSFNPFISEDFQATPLSHYQRKFKPQNELKPGKHKKEHKHHTEASSWDLYQQACNKREILDVAGANFTSTPVNMMGDARPHRHSKALLSQLSPIVRTSPLSEEKEQEFQFKPRIMKGILSDSSSSKENESYGNHQPEETKTNSENSVEKNFMYKPFFATKIIQEKQTKIEKAENGCMTEKIPYFDKLHRNIFFETEFGEMNMERYGQKTPELMTTPVSQTANQPTANTPVSSLSLYRNSWRAENHHGYPNHTLCTADTSGALPDKPVFTDLEDGFKFQPCSNKKPRNESSDSSIMTLYADQTSNSSQRSNQRRSRSISGGSV